MMFSPLVVAQNNVIFTPYPDRRFKDFPNKRVGHIGDAI
jgi:hypothetical protein